LFGNGLLLNDGKENEIMGELVVLVTASSKEEGVRMADCLVSQRLAACVNIIPGIESIYRWEGRIARDEEVLLLIKTTAERFPELELQVKQLHSYSVPEVVAVEIKQGSSAYLKWLRDSTLPDGDPKQD
jgi:periplasmic divalent cation tolerance protein